MITIELQLDDIDYDKIFAVYYGQARELLAQSDEPAATLMARVPEAMARTIWNGLTHAQKEKIAAALLRKKAADYADTAVQQLRQQSIDLRVKKVSVKAQ